MSEAKFTDEQLKQAIVDNLPLTQFAKEHNASIRQVRRRKAQLVTQGFDPKNGLNTHYEHPYFLSKATIHRKANGEIAQVWERMCLDRAGLLTMMEQWVAGMVEDMPKFEPVAFEGDVDDDCMAVYPLGDPHIGMLAWGRETGEDWDLGRAEYYFCRAFDRVITEPKRCGHGVIVNLGDFFHADNMDGVTTRSGHALDVDGRYAKMVMVGVKIMRQMITTALQHHKHVTVINCIGNHDDTSAIFLSVLLNAVYENDPRVTVEISAAPFNYIEWGNTLLGFHHGHTCKMQNLPGVMAHDQREAWGRTRYHHWMTGHIHHDSRKEIHGCIVESFRTLAAKDAYATWGGYRAGQDIRAMVFHKDHGLRATHFVHIDHIKDLQDKE